MTLKLIGNIVTVVSDFNNDSGNNFLIKTLVTQVGEYINEY